MKPLRVLLVILLAALSTLFLASCAAPPPTRQLLSVTISPASATAPGSAGGQVQFVATGYYNTAPYVVTPLQANWGASHCPKEAATITQDGLATCAQGVSGTTTVEAWVMNPPGAPVCNVIDCAGRPACGNIGTAAQLTCP